MFKSLVEQFLSRSISVNPIRSVTWIMHYDEDCIWCGCLTNTLFTRSKNDLEWYPYRNLDSDLGRDPEDTVPIYMGHSLFNTTKCIKLLFIVQSLLHRNPPYIWIKMI